MAGRQGVDGRRDRVGQMEGTEVRRRKRGRKEEGRKKEEERKKGDRRRKEL
jgi:hypothetical protein